MNEAKDLAVKRLVQQVQSYAKSRAGDVARGAETPQFAALLVRTYGRGIAEAAATAFDNDRAADPIWRALDDETTKIDPEWRKHDQERWAARPADVTCGAAT
jgi:hypothetical protein